VQSAHLVDDDPKRITVRLACGWGTLAGKEFRTHITGRTCGGNGGFRERDRAEVDRELHEAKIRKASGAAVVDENVCLVGPVSETKNGLRMFGCTPLRSP